MNLLSSNFYRRKYIYNDCTTMLLLSRAGLRQELFSCYSRCLILASDNLRSFCNAILLLETISLLENIKQLLRVKWKGQCPHINHILILQFCPLIFSKFWSSNNLFSKQTQKKYLNIFNYLILAFINISSKNVYAGFDVRIKSMFKALVLGFKIWLIMNLLLPSSFLEWNDLWLLLDMP